MTFKITGIVAGLFCRAVAAVAITFAAEPPAPLEFVRVPPTPPDRAEATFRCLHGFTMQLLAAEPLLEDPVALEYDEFGRAWVVEMRDYPYTDKSTDKPNVERTTDAPLGRIRILEDTDGDGRFDRTDIFAEDLSWPTGIALWQGGCYVTATPDVWYLKDTDGDRRADVRRKVFTGFKKLNVQSVINNPRWGLDHKLYCSGASNGGEIHKSDDPTFKPVTFGKADFAFDPRRDADGGETFEILVGGARFGHTFDDWGNRFLCNIRNPVQHVVFENRYLARNPYLPVTDALHDAAEPGDTLPVYRASPPEPWRTARALRYRSETAGTSLPRSELAGEGYFTSACGITLYRGAAYPKEFYGNAFLGEVAGNLIHRQVLTPDGVTFKSRRGDEGAEFVASTDNWFRPVNFTNAPDGTLHVCDMYRETIEHPWSIPDDMKAVLDLESGRDRGRIYRLAPPGYSFRIHRPWLHDATPEELVAALEDPNAWWRETAHRLIFERQDRGCIDPLRLLLRNSKSDLAKIHALWSLEGLKALESRDLSAAWSRQSAPELRRHIIRLTESNMDKLDLSVIDSRWASVIRSDLDREPVVRFQLALSLGFSKQPWSDEVLAIILSTADGDERLVTAALLSCAGRASKVLEHTRDATARKKLVTLIGAEADPKVIVRYLDSLHDVNSDRHLIAGLAEGLRRSGKSLSQFVSSDAAKSELALFFARSSKTALDEGAPIADRVEAMGLLSHASYATAKRALEKILDPKQSQPLQIEAIRALAGFRDAEVPSLLLKNYRSLSPSVRGEIVDALASRTERVPALIDALEQKVVGVGEIPQARRLLLVRSKDPSLGARADKLFAQKSGSRAEIIDRYRAALQTKGDVERGMVIFRRECKACHKLRGEGHEVGPNLATILHRTPDELLTHIMDPSREVSPNYLEYVVSLDDGRVVTGLIAEETAAAITLRRAENQQETILRRNIDEMAASGKSLMPEGLEQKVTVPEMADLLTFLLQRK